VYSDLLSSRIRSSSRSVDDTSSRFAKITLRANQKLQKKNPIDSYKLLKNLTIKNCRMLDNYIFLLIHKLPEMSRNNAHGNRILAAQTMSDIFFEFPARFPSAVAV
jgi:hypothetical protein